MRQSEAQPFAFWQSASTPAFSPATGYYAWWNPDGLGGNPGTWTDSSGNAFTLTQTTTVDQPTLQTLNGHNILNFGTSSFTNWLTFNTGFLPTMSNYVVFIVLQPAGYMTNHNGYVAVDANYYGWALDSEYNSDGATQYELRPATVDTAGATKGEVVTNIQVFTAVSDINLNYDACWTNSSLVFSNYGSGGYSYRLGTGVPARLGGTSAGGGYSGLVGDVIVYTNQITPAQRLGIESGLRSKYGF